MKQKSKSKNITEILKRLKSAKDELTRLKIKHLSIFGSFARGEQKPVSDIDILVKFTEPVGFFHFYDVKIYLESILGRKVDLVAEEAIRPEFQSKIKREKIRAS